MVNSKHAFWIALVLSVIVFALGILIGFILEGARGDSVSNALMNSEANLLDEQLRESVITNFNVSCDVAVGSLFGFADRIYYEALKMEEYGEASNFGDALVTLHKRYDLLRITLWIESIKLNERCGGKYHNVVYLYDYDTKDASAKAEQNVFERMLTELKNKHPTDVLLVPIAVNLGLESTDLVKKSYKVFEVPSIVVDENRTINNLVTYEELEKAVFGAGK
jgi:hypothetical protein